MTPTPKDKQTTAEALEGDWLNEQFASTKADTEAVGGSWEPASIIAHAHKQQRRISDLCARLKVAEEALRNHHKWHNEIGVMMFPPDLEAGQTEPFSLDMSAEYSDSSLCEQTIKALDACNLNSQWSK